MLVRITQVAIVFFLVALLVFFVFIKSDQTTTDSYLDDNEVVTLVDQNDFADNDGDGIPNWEEKLYGGGYLGGGNNSLGDVQVLSEETKPYVFDPQADGLIDLERLVATIQGGGSADQETLERVAQSFIDTGNSGANTSSQTEQYNLIKTNLNALGSPMIRSVTQDQTSSEDLVAFMNNESNNPTAIKSLATLYSKTAQDIKQILSRDLHTTVAGNAQLLMNGFTDMAAALNTITKETVQNNDELRSQEILKYQSAVESVSSATLSLHNLTLRWGITFTTGEPGKYFSFELSG